MKGKSQQRALYLQIRKNMTHSKPRERKQAFSYFQIYPEHSKVPIASAPLNMYQMQLSTHRKISSVYQPNQKSTSLVPGIDDKFLHMRKENYLNTCYNFRKNKLKQISKENKQILKRINSQKSMYSSADLNKSFQSNSEIKKRLSQSKLSQRLKSSRSSERGSINASKYRKSQAKMKEAINIKPTNIKNAKITDLKGFRDLFSNKIISRKQNQSQIPPSSTLNTINKDQNSRKISQRQKYRKTLPVINREQKKLAVSEPKEQGGILHRIAQAMYTVQEQPSPKRTNAYLKSNKTIIA